MQDIQTPTDIRLLVDCFYARVRGDAQIGPIFEAAIGDRWPAHLEKMYRFWETVLLETHTYFGSPFAPHARLPIDASDFDRWLALFTYTIDEHFRGDKAAEAKWRAERMAQMFAAKLAHQRATGATSLM